MRVYILTDKDFDRLTAEIDRDPQYGYRGGSSAIISQEEREKYRESHSFYNFLVRRWIASIKEEG